MANPAKKFDHNGVIITIANDKENVAVLTVGDRQVQVKTRSTVPLELGEFVQECFAYADQLIAAKRRLELESAQYDAKCARVQRLMKGVDDLKRNNFSSDEDLSHELRLQSESVSAALVDRAQALHAVGHANRSLDLLIDELGR